jgi:hypothetical protein
MRIFQTESTPQTPAGLLSKLASAGMLLGRVEAARFLIVNQMRAPGVLANRMGLREGPQAMDVERLGRASEALHYALLQCEPVEPGKQAILRMFPAWPPEWDAAFTLRARGAFLVTSSMHKGQIEFVQIRSEAGAECRLRNPWPESAVSLFRNGKKAEDLSGSLLKFATNRGETIVAVKQGSTPDQFRRAIIAPAPSTA